MLTMAYSALCNVHRVNITSVLCQHIRLFTAAIHEEYALRPFIPAHFKETCSAVLRMNGQNLPLAKSLDSSRPAGKQAVFQNNG